MRLFGINFGKPTPPAPPVNGTAVGGHNAPSTPDAYGMQECVTNLIEQGVIDPGAKNIWCEDYLNCRSGELPQLTRWEAFRAFGTSLVSALFYQIPGYAFCGIPQALTRDLFRSRQDFVLLSAGRRLWSQPLEWHVHAKAQKVERAIRDGLVTV